MKISTITGITTIILTSILTANSATAQWTPNDSMFESYSNDRLNRINQPENPSGDGALEDKTLSPAARITKKTAVMYVKDETLNSNNLLEAMESKNIEIGFAEEGEEVTIVEQAEKMRKVRFKETGRLGWISQKSLMDL